MNTLTFTLLFNLILEDSTARLAGEPLIQIAVGMVVLIFGIIALFPVLVEKSHDRYE